MEYHFIITSVPNKPELLQKVLNCYKRTSLKLNMDSYFAPK